MKLVRLIALSGLVALSAQSAFAQTTLNFDQVGCTEGGASIYTSPYIESGFQISGPLLASWCSDATGYYAGTAQLLDADHASASLTKVGGGTFSIQSIDLAHLYQGEYGPQSFTFTGNVFGGGTVSQTFTLAAQNGDTFFTTYNFDGSFTNLTSVDFALQDNPYYQYDSVVLDTETTPEPASLVLIGTGLLGVIGVARRRRVS